MLWAVRQPQAGDSNVWSQSLQQWFYVTSIEKEGGVTFGNVVLQYHMAQQHHQEIDLKGSYVVLVGSVSLDAWKWKEIMERRWVRYKRSPMNGNGGIGLA